MVMKICPNCLISIYYQKNICHQCGYEIDKPHQSSPDNLPRIRSFKLILLHKFKFRRTGKLKLVDWQIKISNAHVEVIFCLTKLKVLASHLKSSINIPNNIFVPQQNFNCLYIFTFSWNNLISTEKVYSYETNTKAALSLACPVVFLHDGPASFGNA